MIHMKQPIEQNQEIPSEPPVAPEPTDDFKLPEAVAEYVLAERSAVEKVEDQKIVEISNVIDFNATAEGSVIVLKVGGDPLHKMRMHQAFVRFINARKELFKQKKFTVLFIEPGEDLSVLSEEDMEKAGWQRKEKSLIINPF